MIIYLKGKLKQILLAAALLTLAVLLLLQSQQAAESVNRSIALCLETLIPSLFCFMTLAAFAVSTGGLDLVLRPLQPLTRYLFKEEEQHTSIILMSMVAGYPVGAKLLAERVIAGEMSRESAERMLCYCVNAGPAFLLSGVSIVKFQNLTCGLLILLSHIFSHLLIGIAMNLRRPVPPHTNAKKRKKHPSLSAALVQSVTGTTHSMALICAMVILFSVFFALFQELGVLPALVNELQRFFPNLPLPEILSGIFEVTGGCMQIPGNSMTSLYVITGLTAFGGFCVQLQVAAITHKAEIRLRKYLLTRLWHTGNSVVICFFLTGLFQPEITAFSVSESTQPVLYSATPLSSYFLIAMCVFLLLSVRKSGKIEP